MWKSKDRKENKKAKKSGTPVESRTLNLLIRSQKNHSISICKSTKKFLVAEKVVEIP